MTETPNNPKHGLTSKPEEEISKYIAPPFQNNIGEESGYVNAIVLALFYSPEMQQRIDIEDFGMEEQFHILVEGKSLLERCKYLTNELYFKKLPKTQRFCNPRNILSELEYAFHPENLFQQGSGGDPSDVFYIFISGIHAFGAGETSGKTHCLEACAVPKCPAHSGYYIDIVEQTSCRNCKAKSDIFKYPFNNFIYEADITKLLKRMDRLQYMADFKGKLFPFFNDINANSFRTEQDRECPNRCEDPAPEKHTIGVKPSPYFTVNFTWGDKMKLSEICRTGFAIPETFTNSDVFDIYDDALVRKYFLYGLICRCDNHYISFYISGIDDFKAQGAGGFSWLYHNDMTVKELPSFKDVIEYCVMNRYHPKMGLYTEVKNVNAEENQRGYRLGKDLTRFKETHLTDGDYFGMMNHSGKIDRENAVSYLNEEKRVRPGETVYTSQDDDGMKSLMGMKNENVKRPDLDGNPAGNEDGGSGRTTSRFGTGSNRLTSHANYDEEYDIYINDPKYQSVKKKPKVDKELRRKQKGMINETELLGEEYRQYPYKRDDNWMCAKRGCGNINNNSTFECGKCKTVNMSVFDQGEQRKKRDEKGVKCMKEGKGQRSNDSGGKRKSQEYYGDIDNMKRCMTCKGAYLDRCPKCPRGKEFVEVRDEKEIKRVYDMMHNKHLIVGNSKDDAGEEQLWRCQNCGVMNLHSDFCGGCKGNYIVEDEFDKSHRATKLFLNVNK